MLNPKAKDEDIITSDISPTEGLAAPEKGLVAELATVPTSVSVVDSQAAKEVTIRQVGPLVLVLTGATFLNTLSVQAVVILLPQITKELTIPQTRQQWIISAFALTSGSFLLLCGKLADVYGRRLLFILGCFWITATALGTAFSPVEVCMYIMRALQGLGAALTIPTAMGILGHTIPPGRVKNYSFAFYSGGAPMGQILGNLLGGVVSQYTSWKVVFYIFASAAFLIALVAYFVIPLETPRNEDTEGRASGVDWVGAFLYTSGTLLLLTGLSEGVSQGWKTPFIIALLVLSVIFFAAFVFWQHYLEKHGMSEPLMRVSIFLNGRFSVALGVVFLFSAGFTNWLVYCTYFYQDYQLLSPIQTTLRFLPLGVVGIFAVTSSGYFLSRVPGNIILIIGLTSGAISNLLFAAPIPPSTSYFAYGFISMGLGAVGADTVYPCLGLFTTQSLPRKDQSLAGAMFQTTAALGRTMFLPITAAIQINVQTREQRQGDNEKAAYLSGLRSAEWFCFALMVVSLGMVIVGLRNIGKIGMLKKLGNVQSRKSKSEV